MQDIMVEPIEPERTHDLRRRVLRGGDPDADLVWVGDDCDDTVHLAVLVGARPVAISTWLVEAFPRMPGARAVQLRGMATDPAFHGRGFGTLLLRAGRDHAASIGAAIVWANARSSALGFYLEHGFEAVGSVFATADTGLPHQLVVAESGVEPASDSHRPASPSPE